MSGPHSSSLSEYAFSSGSSPQAFPAHNPWLALMAQRGWSTPMHNSPVGEPPHRFVPSHPSTFSAQIWNNPISRMDVIYPNEEHHIVRVLSDALRDGRDHCEALNSLNGVNNHLSGVWKDYYIVHQDRLDDQVSCSTNNDHGNVDHDDDDDDADVEEVDLQSTGRNTVCLKPAMKPKKSTNELRVKSRSKHANDLPADEQSSDHEPGSDYDQLNIDVDSGEDEMRLGDTGDPYIASDYRLFARHLASQHPQIAIYTAAASFVERYQSRTTSSWRLFYKSRADQIDKLVRRYRDKDRKAVQQQCGSPKGAAKRSLSASESQTASPATKRVHFDESHEKITKSGPIDETSWKDFA